jgi:hypothetical protein
VDSCVFRASFGVVASGVLRFYERNNERWNSVQKAQKVKKTEEKRVKYDIGCNRRAEHIEEGYMDLFQGRFFP